MIVMGNWVTVSTKARMEIFEKAKAYEINTSKPMHGPGGGYV